jgi:3-dehydroquinate dehydratase/shikimate dehydrogenase
MNTDAQIASHLLRSRLGKICVAITGATHEEMIEKATEVLKEINFIEFRLDYLSRPLAALPRLKQFLLDNTAATAIATCRCEENGGKFHGSNNAALEVLLKAAESGFQIVDIELESIEKLPKNTLAHLREAGGAVIISWHDFHATKDLDGIYKRILPFQPDFIKIVPTARTLSDNLTLMRFLERVGEHANDNVVAICMGEAGIISRVLGLRAGSAFTFAAASVGEETAPGQIAARTLIETYRIDQVDNATKVYGVAGNPLSSSLSPIMMNTAFRRETVNAVYLALQTSKADDLFKLMREIPIQGLSVTMPLKQNVMPLLERTDPLSAKIGAVNTITRLPDGKFYGFNTDVAGIVGPLERRLSLKDAKILVLGAGGAARAAVFGCRDKGAEVWVLNRTTESAHKLARQSGAKTMRRDQLAKTHFDVIINATSVGMASTNGKNAPAAILQPSEINARLVFDLVYNPIETPLLRMARQKGIPVITGVEMFVQQGARQFEIWTGKPAPEEEMLRVVLHSLRQNAEGAEPALPIGKVEILPPPQAAQPEPVVKEEPKITTVIKQTAVKQAATKQAPIPAKPAAAPVAKVAPAKPAPVRVAVKVTAKVTAKAPAKKSAPAKKVAAAKKPTAKPAKKPVAKVVAHKSKAKAGGRR